MFLRQIQWVTENKPHITHKNNFTDRKIIYCTTAPKNSQMPPSTCSGKAPVTIFWVNIFYA